MSCMFICSSCRHRFFSSFAAARSPSSPWISPLQSPDAAFRSSEPPPAASISAVEPRRKSKFVSHDCAIEMIKREKDPKRALDIFNRASEQKGFDHNNATYATIIHKLSKCKKFGAVDSIIRQMTYGTCKFHEGIFVNLMRQFSKSRMHRRVLDMFVLIPEITRERPSPNAMSTCLNLLIESGQIDLAKELLVHSEKVLQFNHNTCTFNILVKYHCRNGDPVSGLEVVKEMKKYKRSHPNLITYSTLMDGLCRAGMLEEAVTLFEEMVSKEQILPDALTYNVLINGFCLGGKVDRARKIIEFMKCNGCVPNVYNYATLINGLCEEGRLQEAKDVLEEMQSSGIKPDAVIYTSLINKLCKEERTNEAMDLFDEMKESGCKPDIVTFNVLIRGLCGEGRLEEALRMLRTIPSIEGVNPNKGTYRIVLNALCRERELEEAIDLLDVMLSKGVVPHYETSNELIALLCENGKGGDAIAILHRLVEEIGFVPRPEAWSALVGVICRERKLLEMFELIEELTEPEADL